MFHPSHRSPPRAARVRWLGHPAFLACVAVLLVNDRYDPNWKVRVIPNKYPVLRVEGEFRSRGTDSTT